MKCFVAAMFHIRKDIIPHAWMLGVVHLQDVNDHPIDHLCLAIDLGGKAMDLVSLVSNNDHNLDQMY